MPKKNPKTCRFGEECRYQTRCSYNHAKIVVQNETMEVTRQDTEIVQLKAEITKLMFGNVEKENNLKLREKDMKKDITDIDQLRRQNKELNCVINILKKRLLHIKDNKVFICNYQC